MIIKIKHNPLSWLSAGDWIALRKHRKAYHAGAIGRLEYYHLMYIVLDHRYLHYCKENKTHMYADKLMRYDEETKTSYLRGE